MAKANKKITSEFLKKREKELNQREKKTIEINGEIYEFEVDKFFVKSKIAELSSDIGLFATLLVEDDKYINLDNAKVSAISKRYIYGMLVKYFTNIGMPNSVADVLVSVKTMEDLGILGDILKCMDEDELTKVLEEVNERLELSVKLYREKLEELNKEIEQQEEEEAKNVEE